MDNLHLVYATDKNYLFPTNVSLSSAIMQAAHPERLRFHVLDCGVPDEMWKTWTRDLERHFPGVSISRHQVDVSRFAGCRTWRGGLSAYARLCLPKLLPDIDWCVYADGDTLFVEDPWKLTELFDDSIALWGWDQQTVGKEANFFPHIRKSIMKWYADRDLQGDFSNYVCSGFLIFNLRWFRSNDAEAKMMEFLSRFPDVPFHDETALNYVCAGHVRLLPSGWGIFSSHVHWGPRPCCIHYIQDLPTRLRFRWRDGFRDVTAVWVNFARVVLGMSVRKSCGIPRWKWMLGRAYNHALRVAVAVIGRTPFGRRWSRMKEFQSLFIPRKTRRWLLSRRLWTERWHGE